jgi:hypothetical protein
MTPSGNESLVEIVARALAKCVDGHERNWADYEPEARAVIASLPDTAAMERIAKLEDEVVTLWHQAGSEDRSLSECLGMSDEEYAKWATGVEALGTSGLVEQEQ